jgi:hypothetical protein
MAEIEATNEEHKNLKAFLEKSTEKLDKLSAEERKSEKEN